MIDTATGTGSLRSWTRDMASSSINFRSSMQAIASDDFHDCSTTMNLESCNTKGTFVMNEYVNLFVTVMGSKSRCIECCSKFFSLDLSWERSCQKSDIFSNHLINILDLKAFVCRVNNQQLISSFPSPITDQSNNNTPVLSSVISSRSVPLTSIGNNTRF